MKNVTFNLLGVYRDKPINQILYYLLIGIQRVFAGGDDRDEGYYENLDEELANFEAQLAEDLANQAALEAFQTKAC